MKLICNPSLPKSPRPDTISYAEAYDIHHIGAFKQGEAEVTASFQLGGRDNHRPTLLFNVRWWPKRDRGVREAEPFSGSMRLPLWFHRSSSCVLVVLDEIENNLPPEALAGRDTRQDMQADIPSVEIHDQHAPPPENPPVANVLMVAPEVEMLDERGPPQEDPPVVNTQAGTPSAEMHDEHGHSPENPPVANMHMVIPSAESSVRHEPPTQIAPVANMQPDVMYVDTKEVGAGGRTGYMEEICGSRGTSHEMEVPGRYSESRSSLRPPKTPHNDPIWIEGDTTDED